MLGRLNPRNRERLTDEDMATVITRMNREGLVTTFDPLWITNAMEHQSEERRRFYHAKVANAIRSSNSVILLFPLYEDEHWSLLVLFAVGVAARREDGTVNYMQHFLLDSASRHDEYAQTVLVHFNLDHTTVYELPKKVPQQKSDWECGHFVLMNLSMLIEYCRGLTAQTPLTLESLRSHLLREMMAASQRNIRAFAQRIIDAI